MNEMLLAKLIAEETVNIMIERGIISVRGCNTTSYDPDRRIESAEPTVGYDDVVRIANQAVNNGTMYSSTRNLLLSVVPVDGNESYYKAVIEIVRDSNTLPSSKLDLVKRITSRYGYSK